MTTREINDNLTDDMCNVSPKLLLIFFNATNFTLLIFLQISPLGIDEVALLVFNLSQY